MSETRTIAFFPEPGAWGPTNNCAAMAGVLRARGHRCVFVVDESFAGVLDARGFEERRFRMSPPDEGAGEAGDEAADPWTEFIRVTAPEFRKPTIAQIETVTKPIWEALVAGERHSHERVLAIWDEVRPDVVVSDNVTGYPAVELAGAPWVRVVSCNALEMRDPALPPALSGLPAGDQSQWRAFRDEYHRVHLELLARHNDFRRAAGVTACPPDEFNSSSPWLNLYEFPGAIDYPRTTPLDGTWHRLESSVRDGEPAFDLAERLPGEGRVDLRIAGLAGLHGRRPDAAADRRARGHAASCRGVDGSAAASACAWGRACTASRSCRSPPSCPSATCSSPTAATTPSARASTSACR